MTTKIPFSYFYLDLYPKFIFTTMIAPQVWLVLVVMERMMSAGPVTVNQTRQEITSCLLLFVFLAIGSYQPQPENSLQKTGLHCQIALLNSWSKHPDLNSCSSWGGLQEWHWDNSAEKKSRSNMIFL